MSSQGTGLGSAGLTIEEETTRVASVRDDFKLPIRFLEFHGGLTLSACLWHGLANWKACNAHPDAGPPPSAAD